MKIPVLVILLFMIFLHIIDDYHLQGILISMKQKIWWKEQCLDSEYKKYKNDYIPALICHSFSWSFMIMLPILVYNFSHLSFYNYYGFFILNWIIHGYVDNEKANKRSINLIVDQSAHFIQIILSWVFCCILLCLK